MPVGISNTESFAQGKCINASIKESRVYMWWLQIELFKKLFTAYDITREKKLKKKKWSEDFGLESELMIFLSLQSMLVCYATDSCMVFRQVHK